MQALLFFEKFEKVSQGWFCWTLSQLFIKMYLDSLEASDIVAEASDIVAIPIPITMIECNMTFAKQCKCT